LIFIERNHQLRLLKTEVRQAISLAGSRGFRASRRENGCLTPVFNSR